MVAKVNGGIESGVWVERDVQFVTLTFSADITTSAFDIPNSVLDNAVQKLVENKATVLAVSELYSTGTKIDIMLGHAQGWTAAANDGVIATGVDVTGLDTAGDALAATVGINFAVFSGLRAATSADLTEFNGEFFRSI